MIESQSKLITSIYLAEGSYRCGFSLIFGGFSYSVSFASESAHHELSLCKAENLKSDFGSSTRSHLHIYTDKIFIKKILEHHTNIAS